MPRVRKLTEGERMNDQFLAAVDKYKRLSGIRTYSELGKVIGTSGATVYNRLKDLGALKVEEVRSLVRRLKIPPEELLGLFYEKEKLS